MRKFYQRQGIGQSTRATLGKAHVSGARDIPIASWGVCSAILIYKEYTCRHAITCSHACNYMLNVFKVLNLIKKYSCLQVFMSVLKSKSLWELSSFL